MTAPARASARDGRSSSPARRSSRSTLAAMVVVPRRFEIRRRCPPLPVLRQLLQRPRRDRDLLRTRQHRFARAVRRSRSRRSAPRSRGRARSGRRGPSGARRAARPGRGRVVAVLGRARVRRHRRHAVEPRARTHLALVQTSFALLLVFVASLVVLQVRNGAPRPWLGANLAFVVVLAAYVVLVTVGPSVATPRWAAHPGRRAEDRRVRRGREPRGSGLGCHALDARPAPTSTASPMRHGDGQRDGGGMQHDLERSAPEPAEPAAGDRGERQPERHRASGEEASSRRRQVRLQPRPERAQEHEVQHVERQRHGAQRDERRERADRPRRGDDPDAHADDRERERGARERPPDRVAEAVRGPVLRPGGRAASGASEKSSGGGPNARAPAQPTVNSSVAAAAPQPNSRRPAAADERSVRPRSMPTKKKPSQMTAG